VGFEDWYLSEPDSGDPDGITCKFCGVRELVWENIAGAWCLVTVGGARHRCPGDMPPKSTPLDDFKDHLDPR
jgi:hypothetical protein